MAELKPAVSSRASNKPDAAHLKQTVVVVWGEEVSSKHMRVFNSRGARPSEYPNVKQIRQPIRLMPRRRSPVPSKANSPRCVGAKHLIMSYMQSKCMCRQTFHTLLQRIAASSIPPAVVIMTLCAHSASTRRASPTLNPGI